MFGQKIIKDYGDGRINVKYKHNLTYTHMKKKEYYLQLWTFCGDFGEWPEYIISDIWCFFANKFAFIWLSVLALFISKAYIEDVAIKYWIHYGVAALLLFEILWMFIDGRMKFPIFTRIGILLFAEAAISCFFKVFDMYPAFRLAMRYMLFGGILIAAIGIIQYIIYRIVCAFNNFTP